MKENTNGPYYWRVLTSGQSGWMFNVQLLVQEPVHSMIHYFWSYLKESEMKLIMLSILFAAKRWYGRWIGRNDVPQVHGPAGGRKCRLSHQSGLRLSVPRYPSHAKWVRQYLLLFYKSSPTVKLSCVFEREIRHELLHLIWCWKFKLQVHTWTITKLFCVSLVLWFSLCKTQKSLREKILELNTSSKIINPFIPRIF